MSFPRLFYVVSNPAQCKELQALLTRYRYDNNQALEIPIAFMTLGGNQLCKLPDLSQAKHHQIQPAQSTSFSYQQPVTPNPPTQPRSEDIQHQLEFTLQQSPDFQQSDESDRPGPIDLAAVPSHLRALVEYSLKYGWVKGADIQRNVRAYDGMSTAEIRRLFLEATNQGIGKTIGEGDRVQFNADSAADRA